MTPIAFTCHQRIPRAPDVLCVEVADVSLWNTFGGYGPLPGIRRATYAQRTDDMVGSRIVVENTDGSRHTEVIEVWRPGEAITMRFEGFTPPLALLATHFMEYWRLSRVADGTDVTRTFHLYPRNALAWPILWVISHGLRRAVAHQMETMAGATR